jgi:stage III sporulation protein AH
MINKQSLWFLTLFSLILVLSVYYITMPSEILSPTVKENNNKSVVIQESEVITALREQTNEERLTQIKDLRMVLTNIEATVEEKNNAYEKLKLLDVIKGKEEMLETKIKNSFNLKSFIKIDNNQIKVVVASDKGNVELANKVMRSIQEEFTDKMYISVKFQV